MNDLLARRRDLLISPLLAALPAAFLGGQAEAAGVDPTQTIVKLPDQVPWEQLYTLPTGAAEVANLQSKTSEPGQYFILIRWHPGYMSAPHWYETDRLCIVLAGTWWVASGEDFAPERTVPVPAGGYVRRVARTPHYDGVKKGEQPAIIALSGIGPIHYNLIDPSKPGWREV